MCRINTLCSEREHTCKCWGHPNKSAYIYYCVMFRKTHINRDWNGLKYLTDRSTLTGLSRPATWLGAVDWAYECFSMLFNFKLINKKLYIAYLHCLLSMVLLKLKNNYFLLNLYLFVIFPTLVIILNCKYELLTRPPPTPCNLTKQNKNNDNNNNNNRLSLYVLI